MSKEKKQEALELQAWANLNGVDVSVKSGTPKEQVIRVLRGLADYTESGKLPRTKEIK